MLQHTRDEAEFMRKRAWDFVSKLEELEKEERELSKSVNADKYNSLQLRISNTRLLLETYKSEYEAMCKEAGIPPEIIGTGAADDDSSPSRNIKNNQKVDLPPLFLVPARNPNFLGRDDDVKKFVQLVLDGGAFAICGVKGMGGIGKTEIAKEVCHIFHDTWQEQPNLPEYLTDILEQKKGGYFQDGILWIPFHPEGQTPKTLTDDLIFGLIKKYPEISSKINKMTLDELADALAGKDILVVLDNVEQNLRTLDYVLERFKGRFHLLITSRIAIPGIKGIDIDTLSEEDAEKLFLRYIGNPQLSEEEEKTVRALCKLMGNHPLFIRNCASKAKADNSNLAELLKKYEENPVQLLDVSNDSFGIDPRHIDVRTCFRMSFESLDEEQQRVFLHASLFNNPFAVELLAALVDNVDKDDIFPIVERMECLSLINRLAGNDGRTTYELHPLMREFALDLLMQTVAMIPDRKEKIRTLLKELQQAKEEKVLLEKLKNDKLLVKQTIQAVQYCDQVFDFDLVLNFAQVLDGQLDSLISYDERLRLNQLAIRAAVALQQDLNEKHYRKQRADLEKQKGMFKNKFEFVGREKELKEFENEFLFHHESFILNIHTNGQGGVGKTQLLQQMLKLCRSKYADKLISSDELIDFYYTEARSKAGIIDQIIKKLGIDYFPDVARQLERYHQTKDSSERQYVLDDAVTALRENYKVIAALWERAGKIIILFFDTYEVIQFVDKEKNIAERSDFSQWLETEFFPALQSENTRLVIAGRFPLIDAAKESVAPKLLSLFAYEEAVDFMAERLKKVAEFSKEEYQVFLNYFPQADHFLKPFRDNLEEERIGVRLYEFSDEHRKELGEDVWQALQNKVPVKKERELLEELKLTKEELKTVIKLAGNRPIYLALFMDWVHFSQAEPSDFLRKAQNISEEEAKREFFENKVLEWLWNDADKRKYIYYMTVAYRRMTVDIMRCLTGDSLEKCEKILMEELRHLSFIKCKEDEQNGDIVLLHDEMRELIVNRWANKIDHKQEERREVLKKLVFSYKEKFLSPDYTLTDISCNKLKQQNVPQNIIGKIKAIDSLYFTREAFVADLQSKGGLTKKELDNYSSEIFNAAVQEVSQEKREVYFPEFMEYTFMTEPDNGVQCFCDEFDIAMEDGRSAYAGAIGREAVVCRAKYHTSPLNALEIDLRDAQHYIDSHKANIKKALEIIKRVNEQQQYDESWKDSLLCGKFTLWEGIAEFWQDNFEKVIYLLIKSDSIFSYNKKQDLLYLTKNWIGYVYYRKAEFVEAEYWMNVSLTKLMDLLSEELDDNKRRRSLQQRIQYSLGNLAMLYRYTGKFIKAIRYAEMQFNIVKSLPRNKKEILRSLNTLSHVSAIAGRTVDARQYLEEAEGIYKEIPDRLLGGRLYSTFCQLSYGTMEFANLLECYRAEELHRAVENSHGKNVQEYIEYAEKAIQCLGQKPIFHKELADAYFSLGELYMMMPANHPDIQRKGDKWKLAEQAFEKALEFGRKSQFQYRVVDTLESLVTLYYFQSQAEKISLEQKKKCAEKQNQYQDEIEIDWKIQQYPNLLGRYELTKGDIRFDKALEKLKAEYPKADKGVEDLIEAFNHYTRSAACKKKFNKNRYYLMLRVIYNRLDKLVELTHPYTFPRLESLDYEQQVELHEEPKISGKVLSLLKIKWENKEEDFKRILNDALLLGKKEIEPSLKKLEDELAEHDRTGAYWKAVLANKCLTELLWIQIHIIKDDQKKELQQQNLVLHLHLQSRQYRLMEDSFHAKRSYERAEKVITKKIENSRIKMGLDGYTAIVKGEYCARRTEFAHLLEYLVVDELEAGREKFKKQFPDAFTEDTINLFKNGQKLLQQVLQDDRWKNQPLPKRDPYAKKLAEAYFMSAELFILMGRFYEAFDHLEMCMNHIERCVELYHKSGHHYRLDDAKQSYMTAIYFSSGKYGSQERKEKYEQELEKTIEDKDYSRPWVAARFRITQGDVLFSECYEIDKSVNTDSSSYKFKMKNEKKVERKDLVQMFRKYIEACNYKAGYNELSFEAGLRVLRRRIEMIPDSESLDMLLDEKDGLSAFWNASNHLKEKKEELDSILQLIRMRSLILQYEE